MPIAKLTIDMEARLGSLETELKRISSVADGVASKLTSSFKAIGFGLAGIGAGVGLSTLKGKFDEVIESASRLKEMSDVTGASVENLSGLASVAKVTATDMGLVESALNKLSKGLHQSDEDSKGFGKALAFIGLKMEDLRGQDPAQNFLAIAKALDGLEDGTGKVAVGTALLGKQYTAIAGYMKDVAQSGDLIVKTTESQAVAAKNYEEDLRRLTMTKNALYKTVSLELAPAFDALVKAMIGARNEVNGVLSATKGLAEDGSIRQWGIDAVTVAGNVIDAFQGVTRFFEITGKLLGATAAAGVQAASGNFAAASTAFKEWAADRDKIVGQSYFSEGLKKQTNALQEHWKNVEFVKKAYATFPKDIQAKAIKSLEESFYGEGRTRKSAAGFVAAPETSGGKGAKEKDDYSRLIASLNEKIAVEQLNIDTVGKATQAEKDYAKFQADVASGAVKLTTEQQRVVEAYYATYIARQTDAKAAAELNKAIEDQAASMRKYSESLEDQLTKLQRETELYGLSESAIAARSSALLEDAIATARANGAAEDSIAYLEKELELRKAISEQTDKKEVASILAQTDTAKAKALEARKALLEREKSSGSITEKQYEEAMKVLESETDAMGEFMKQAARNAQDAMAEFFINPTRDGMQSIGQSFSTMLQKMIAQAASAQLLKLMFGDMDKTGNLGGWIGKLFGNSGSLFSSSASVATSGSVANSMPVWVDIMHGGGIAGAGGLPGRGVSMLAFANAPRFHNGGIPGLASNEVPAILQKGELVLTKQQQRGRSANITVNVNSTTGDPAEIRRSAAAGARTALGIMGGARRYG